MKIFEWDTFRADGKWGEVARDSCGVGLFCGEFSMAMRKLCRKWKKSKLMETETFKLREQVRCKRDTPSVLLPFLCLLI